MSEHTPTPWEIVKRLVDPNSMSEYRVMSGNNTVAEVNEYEDANFIVRAVNNHEALLEAAKHFQEKYESERHSEYDFPGNPWSYERDGDKESIRHAKTIAQAEGIK